eukprot:1161924-Pelagomonas_calceolata.AAC.7
MALHTPDFRAMRKDIFGVEVPAKEDHQHATHSHVCHPLAARQRTETSRDTVLLGFIMSASQDATACGI